MDPIDRMALEPTLIHLVLGGPWGTVADTGSALSLMTLTLMGVGSSGPTIPANSGLTAPGLGEVASWRSATRPGSNSTNAVSFSSARTTTRFGRAQKRTEL